MSMTSCFKEDISSSFRASASGSTCAGAGLTFGGSGTEAEACESGFSCV